MPAYVTHTSSSGSDTIAKPAGGSVGDLMAYMIRANNPDCLGTSGIGWSPAWLSGWTMGMLMNVDASFSPVDRPGISDCNFAIKTGVRIVDGSEPSSYTFTDILAGPLTTLPVEIVMMLFTDIDPSVPVDDWKVKTNFVLSGPQAQTGSAVCDAVTTIQPTLLIAMLGAENQLPAAPSGFTSRYSGTRSRIATKDESATGAITVPAVSLSPDDAWMVEIIALTGEAVEEPPEPGFRDYCQSVNMEVA
jgi:hypothetical protein